MIAEEGRGRTKRGELGFGNGWLPERKMEAPELRVKKLGMTVEEALERGKEWNRTAEMGNGGERVEKKVGLE